MNLQMLVRNERGENHVQVVSRENLELDQRSSWEETIVDMVNPDQRAVDSIDLLTDASHKLEVYTNRGWFCSDESSLLDATAQQRQCERMALLCAEAHWYDDVLLGFALVRRMWMNNLFLDFLATNPKVIMRNDVGGIGAALFNGVVEFAGLIGAKSILIETTDVSAGFYMRVLRKQRKQNFLTLNSKKTLQHLVAQRKATEVS